MTKTILLAIAALFLMTSMAFTSGESGIVGNWQAADIENATVKVYKDENGYYYGKIIKCDRIEWIGEFILKKVKYEAENNEWKGELHSLARDATIDVRISLESQRKLKLVGKKFFMTKTFFWEK